MREIRFRVWDMVSKQMIYDTEDHDFMISLCGELYQNRGEWEKVDYRFELMQYADWKDKNGEEIYEGDIAIYKNENANKRDRFVVIFIGGSFYFSRNLDDCQGSDPWSDHDGERLGASMIQGADILVDWEKI